MKPTITGKITINANSYRSAKRKAKKIEKALVRIGAASRLATASLEALQKALKEFEELQAGKAQDTEETEADCNCENCRHHDSPPNAEPCWDCSADADKWEPEP